MSTRSNSDNCCEQRIDAEMKDRLEDIRRRLSDPDETLDEYGLCFDYVAPGTFSDQAEGYFRYQLSWGGPSDEFRFFVNPNLSCHRIEYWFLDWFDGAHRALTSNETATAIWQSFEECGCVQAAFARAMDSPP